MTEETAPQAAKPGPAKTARRGLLRFWPLIPMGLILITLMFEDLHVMGWSITNQADGGCGLQELDQSSLSERLYDPIAERGVRTAGSPRVAIVEMDQPDLLENVCASRAFLTRLVPDLAKLGAQVVMIDKYYSTSACDDDKINTLFQSTLETSAVPVVVGSHTNPLPSGSSAGGCLAIPTDAMQFKPGTAVQKGLIRLNADTLKIPIRWPVFDATKNPPAQLPPEQGDTIALLAAQAADPGIEKRGQLPKLIAKSINPYTTFIDLPTINELTAVCSAEPDPIVINGKMIDCGRWRHPAHDLTADHQSLQGKVVAVGDVSDDDMQSFPGGDKLGVYLQANYVESLLDQRFLTEVPIWVTLTTLVLFIVAVYALYWAHDASHKPYISSPERAFIASIIAFAVLLLVSFQALLVFQYFTPLWALWGAGFFLVFRYLEESGYHRSQHLLAEIVGEVEHIAGRVEHAVEGQKSHPKEGEE